MDDEGYPDEDDLKRVRNWPLNDMDGVFPFLRERWKYADAGYWSEGFDPQDEDQPVYFISTAGWSGNESLIEALQENANGIFWAVRFVQHRRGGHYILTRTQDEAEAAV
jgi:hypothetical protein